MRIFNKHVKGVSDKPAIGEDVAEGTIAIYDATAKMWVPLAAGDIPVSVAGVTATTLNAALLEIFSAIS